ncbi:type VI secretion system baseplate subunit TssE [Erwinia psidii]|uniref:Type VI secretion system baseplate subunit TssE n=1 Tax=Erwinia psidii TaxID=69224 RepID=A0A3N6RVF0_9GAMM|nr:type VI secretion system baseplate subunit TssE [Erwinia psidii]MCX8959398.1 type VI secretion system baseplate subunit TssE [Erwinia psidii]MCX8962654.1 type VI secretion system baseplate subunit TssE [Erwinia psidii]MCX8964250.1 type VI secretion system baseplate subunit TssE [Erwinia psidii]RQM36914.1 type VI secretion system baseplate subunit TssE [Erwinia psidii]
MSNDVDPSHQGSDLLRGGFRYRNRQDALNVRDKMQPSLLDRLTDNAPDKQQEAVSNTVISHSALRRNVLRDLQWLFNCINNEAQQDLQPFSHVQRSVYNFGVAPLAGQRMSDIEWQDIQRKLTNSILHFEPRILPAGLQVRCVSDTGSLNLHNVLSIEIKGRLWCVPYPLEFMFRTELDLENGHFELKDVG